VEGLSEVTIQPAVFRKRPVTIDAVQFNAGEYTKGEWLELCPEANIGAPMSRDADGEIVPDSDLDSTDIRWFIIPTLEGNHEASDGDWFITGVKGEHYFCKPDVFEQSYDTVTDRDQQLAHSAVKAMRGSPLPGSPTFR
jgi:hypothetical protein